MAEPTRTIEEQLRALVRNERERLSVPENAADDLRMRVATAKGIPQLADRLRGETQAELEADADKLAGALPEPQKTTIDQALRQEHRQQEQELRSRYGLTGKDWIRG